MIGNSDTDDYQTHDVRFYDGAWWVFVNGSPYRKATVDEVFAGAEEYQYTEPIGGMWQDDD